MLNAYFKFKFNNGELTENELHQRILKDFT